MLTEHEGQQRFSRRSKKKMTRGRTKKHRANKEKELNAKDEEGGVKGLREVRSSCLITEIIICNHLTQKVRSEGQKDK